MSLTKRRAAVTRRTLATLVAALAVASACGYSDGAEREREEREPRENENERDENESGENEPGENEPGENESGENESGEDSEGEDSEGGDERDEPGGSGKGKCVENPGECEPGG